MAIKNLPNEIAILTTKDNVCFPNVTLTIELKSEQIPSINFAQSNKSSDDIRYLIVRHEQSLDYGTIAKIKAILPSNNSFTVELEGLFAYDIKNTIVNIDHVTLSTEGVCVLNRYDKNQEELIAIKAKLFHTLENYHSHFNSKAILSILHQFSHSSIDLSALVNGISTVILIDLPAKINLLKTQGVESRANDVIKILESHIASINWMKELTDKTVDTFTKNQKNQFLKEQMQVIKKELGEDVQSPNKDLREKVRNTAMPIEARKVALEELSRLEFLHPQSSEYNIVKQYLENIIQIPWIKKSKENIDYDLAQKILNHDHFGLETVKRKILEHIAIAQIKNSFKAQIICLVGPPGVGKTSISKSIASALGRKFARISLGGVRDESEIRGHRRTYVGSMPGKLISTLKKLEVNNPLILLDEIDKLTISNHGDPASALLEVLDPEQNSSFLDHYLDIPFDLSNVLFVATANYLENIPPALRDRLEIIELSSYTQDEKVHIASNHLLPKVKKEFGLDKFDLNFSDEVIDLIINSYTREAGVRDLQRKISSVLKFIAPSMVKNGSKDFTISKKTVEEALGHGSDFFNKRNQLQKNGLVNGLAWTPVGGDILTIEAIDYEGSGRITLTGSLGDVMKESAHLAFSLLKHTLDKINLDKLNTKDFHIHVPAGSVKKDGPSAGITLFTSLYSLVNDVKIDNHLAFTGELSLSGQVLAVGGIKEKVIAAHKNQITHIILPKSNEKDINEIPEQIRKQLDFQLVENIDQVIKIISSPLKISPK